MRIAILCALALAFLVAQSEPGRAASGGFISAAELDNECDAEAKSAPHHFCLGYVGGVADTVASYEEHGNVAVACLPDKVTLSKLVEVFRAYFDLNPETFEDAAQDVVMMALSQAYPCTR